MRSTRDEHGSAMVEFAVFLSLLVTVLVGMVDYTFAVHQAMQVQAAASAAAAWGTQPGNESNLAGIQNAANAAGNGINGFSATATNLWTCSAGGSSVASTTICSTGFTPWKYVVVKTKGTIPATLTFPGISANGTVYGSAIFPVPWSQ